MKRRERDARGYTEEERKIIETAGAGSGMSFDEFVAQMKQTAARKAARGNGSSGQGGVL